MIDHHEARQKVIEELCIFKSKRVGVIRLIELH